MMKPYRIGWRMEGATVVMAESEDDAVRQFRQLDEPEIAKDALNLEELVVGVKPEDDE